MCVRDVSAVPLTREMALTAWEKHRVGLRLMTGEQENCRKVTWKCLNYDEDVRYSQV
jgi:hypothetical protein